jgi:hypothetical protein
VDEFFYSQILEIVDFDIELIDKKLFEMKDIEAIKVELEAIKYDLELIRDIVKRELGYKNES